MSDSKVWSAKWISLSPDPREDLGVFAFRRRVELAKTPAEFKVRVSADQRYKLYANGELVGLGPQRGDLLHWFYETHDLAPFLQVGENWIAAIVWNFGRWAPMAQMSARTGFVLEGEDISTPGGWEVLRLEGWSFDMMHAGVGEFYIDVGPGEIIEAGKGTTSLISVSPLEPGLGLSWREPNVICQAEERGASGGGTPWMLLPRTLPPMRLERRADPPVIRRGFAGDGPQETPADGESLWPRTQSVLKEPLRLTPGQPLLLDFQELLTAYPNLFLSAKGKAEVRLTYDEALWNPDGTKGNRDEVQGKESRGYQDCFRLNGWSAVFEPLWWRTFRYLKIETDAPCDLLEIGMVETGYPLEVESSFEADDPWVANIWDVAVRTAERCAGETYFDCPYYEQLQYVGDTRIQALIGYYLGRDRALQRNAVETLGWSLMENGLTQSRYPSRQVQVIPPFSLWWVLMLWDQLYYDDPGARPDFVSFQTLNRVLGRFRKLQREEGQFWQFGDWVPTWPWGVPPGGANALMHRLTLDIATIAAERYKTFLEVGEAKQRDPRFWTTWGTSGWGELSMSQRTSVDHTPTEHAEALSRLHHLMYRDDVEPWPTGALAKADAAKCTFYFSYYKHLAMFGREDAPFDYLSELQPWKEMIEDGLTTFAETPEPTRSDCHAWSAHPILGFFQIVAGVTSAAPGWKRARIMPHPGSLTRFDARIAHPDGELRVRFEGGKLDIDSPIPFELRWKGSQEQFPPGRLRA